MIAHARQVLHAAAADEHQRVLLEVVTDTRDVGRHLDLVGEADAGHLAERRVRLLRGLREDADADAALLRALVERRTLGLGDDGLAALAHKLADSRHTLSRCFGRPADVPARSILSGKSRLPQDREPAHST